jgi:large subunit ribosomal protein L25
MADFKFESEVRNEFGKGFARRIRSAGRVPAAIYSKGGVPLHITLPTHEVTQAVRLPNALFEVKVAGKDYPALVKDIQRDFVTRDIEHIDLLAVTNDQIVTVPVALKVEGEPKPGTQVSTAVKSVRINVAAGSIPRYIVLNIEGAEIGAHFKVADIELPAGATPAVDPERVITVVRERAKQKVVQVDVAGGGEEATEGGEEASEEAAAE